MAKERSTTFFRANDWWIGKASTLLALVYLFSYLLGISFSKFLWLGAASLIIIIGFASFGYLTNDWFDQEQDALAGKKNIFQNKSSLIAITYFVFALLTILLPWIILPHNTFSYALIFFELFLFLIYSVPPIRLKERKYFGPVVDALYAHAVPAYFALHTFQLAAGNSLSVYFVAVLILWQFFIGFRNILIHQMNDAEKDKKAGAKNWSTSLSTVAVNRSIYVLVFIETLLIAFMIVFIFKGNYIVQWASLSALLFLSVIYFLKNTTGHGPHSMWFNWRNFPNLFYEFFLPAYILIAAIITDSNFIWVLIAHAALFYIPILYNILNSLFYYALQLFFLFVSKVLIPIRRLLSFIINNSIYYVFKLFGVNLIKEKMSAADYLRKKITKN